MSEVSLYRKYRPQNFQNLVGQDHIRTTLSNALQEGHPAHAYLFCGPRGTGKTSTARLLAKALNCLQLTEEGEPCDTCELCEAIREGNLIDLIEIDAASNRGIDEIRELKDKINFAPTRSKSKVYIIDEVHMLTKEAFNALLKTLEEPPSHVYFVLATTESHKIPETIISRCQRFDFKRITQKAISTRLMYIAQLENIEIEQEAIDAIAHTAEGGLRDAIGLLEQLTIDNKLTFDRVREVLGISGPSSLEDLYKHLAANDTQSGLVEIQNLYAEGLDLIQFTKDFLEHLRVKLLDATQQGNMQETKALLGIINNFQKAYDQLKRTTIPQLPLEIAIIETTGNLENVVVKAAPKQTEQVQVPAPTPMPATEPPELQAPKAVPQEEPAQPERAHTGIKRNISEQEREVPQEKVPLTISYVKENWPRVLDLIKTPFLKMSLKEGKPISVENGEVMIEFTSSFHKEKINSAEITVEVEQALNSIFADPAKVVYSLRKVDLSTKSVDEEESAEDEGDLAGQALEMFGGELIEE
ncbi:DNA polymerase III subunit gamma/tau [Patescibacteria group bacterium]